MADELTNFRIVLSRNTLAKYEQMAAQHVVPEQTLKLLREEVAILQEIIARYPEKALNVRDLVRRWKALARRVGDEPRPTITKQNLS